MPFKICAIGCGPMRTEYHGPALARYAATHPDTLLSACCDLDAQKATQCQKRFGFARRYTDFRRMLDAERPDAVTLVVREHLTADLSCKVLSMGYPLIMEKPPGRTVEEIDRMISAAVASGAAAQVAFNRRYTPMVRKFADLVGKRFKPSEIQHLRYDFVRFDRRDEDFALTAIHGIDTARFLLESDYNYIRFHYQPFPSLGPTVANVFMDCQMTSGATAHLAFCPVAGVQIERATLHALDNTFFLNIPIWDAFDTPGKIQHIEKGEIKVDILGEKNVEPYERFGFYGENESFFEDIRNGRRPAGDLPNARQSVEIAEYMRERRPEYKK